MKHPVNQNRGYDIQKIKVIYVIKFPVCNKSIPKLRFIPKNEVFFPNLRLFYCIFRLAHHHHGIPMPPPSVMLSMPPPTVNMASGNVMTTHAPQHITPHSNHMHIQHVVHHHSP